MIRPELDMSQEEIADFCRRHHIRWLAIFGSALRDDFSPTSDVDVLVEFEPGQTPGLAFFGLPDELSNLVGGRPVDLTTVEGLNRWIRGPVLREARVLWSASERDGPRVGESPVHCGEGGCQATLVDSRTGSDLTSPQKEPLVESRDLLYLGHMLDTAKEGREIVAGLAKERYDGDRVLQLALTRVVEVIGEAARRVSPVGRAHLSDLPWPKITGMRHRLVHDYTSIDLEEVWRTSRRTSRC